MGGIKMFIARIFENGVYRDMTAAEMAELERLQAEMPAPEPTAEERLAALEEAMLELLGWQND